VSGSNLGFSGQPASPAFQALQNRRRIKGDLTYKNERRKVDNLSISPFGAFTVATEWVQSSDDDALLVHLSLDVRIKLKES